MKMTVAEFLHVVRGDDAELSFDVDGRFVKLEKVTIHVEESTDPAVRLNRHVVVSLASVEE